MWPVAGLILAVMAIKDTLYTASTSFVAKGRALLASAFDTGGDLASALTYGVSGVLVFKHGLSVYTALIFAAMAVGSYAGTFTGMAVSKWIEGRSVDRRQT